MTWRVALALVILLVWGWLLQDARNNSNSKELFDTYSPIALAAVTYIFTQPLVQERRRKKRERRRSDNDDS